MSHEVLGVSKRGWAVEALAKGPRYEGSGGLVRSTVSLVDLPEQVLALLLGYASEEGGADAPFVQLAADDTVILGVVPEPLCFSWVFRLFTCEVTGDLMSPVCIIDKHHEVHSPSCF